jgi:ABC-type nitrate/sulfonate/bicarbonate transport system substrate-binding protein
MTHSFQPNKITRRQALWFAIAPVASVGLHACTKLSAPSASPVASDNANGFSLGITTWIGYTPLYIGLAKGFVQRLGARFEALITVRGEKG